ncbi:hypothetical protein OE88DRAFT_1662884 [Heliocybe sulcata]|uniref:Uncharacterized protein n=1 Tax=Heliocybe sulcata TaxID=5364 RepID=A0A5C3MWW2_9AGAM|nr:hypothetical protein OE88DRAFT_1662884 [Heliocybe sulcata]
MYQNRRIAPDATGQTQTELDPQPAAAHTLGHRPDFKLHLQDPVCMPFCCLTSTAGGWSPVWSSDQLLLTMQAAFSPWRVVREQLHH